MKKILKDLVGIFFYEEIKHAVFALGSLKASGPDGLHALFFQSQWSTIGQSDISV